MCGSNVAPCENVEEQRLIRTLRRENQGTEGVDSGAGASNPNTSSPSIPVRPPPSSEEGQPEACCAANPRLNPLSQSVESLEQRLLADLTREAQRLSAATAQEDAWAFLWQIVGLAYERVSLGTASTFPLRLRPSFLGRVRETFFWCGGPNPRKGAFLSVLVGSCLSLPSPAVLAALRRPFVSLLFSTCPVCPYPLEEATADELVECFFSAASDAIARGVLCILSSR